MSDDSVPSWVTTEEHQALWARAVGYGAPLLILQSYVMTSGRRETFMHGAAVASIGTRGPSAGTILGVDIMENLETTVAAGSLNGDAARVLLAMDRLSSSLETTTSLLGRALQPLAKQNRMLTRNKSNSASSSLSDGSQPSGNSQPTPSESSSDSSSQPHVPVPAPDGSVVDSMVVIDGGGRSDSSTINSTSTGSDGTPV